MTEHFIRIAINNTALYTMGGLALVYGIVQVRHTTPLTIIKTILIAAISLLALGTAAAPSSETGIPILTDVWLNACLACLGTLFFIEDRHHWLTDIKSTIQIGWQKLKQAIKHPSNHSD